MSTGNSSQLGEYRHLEVVRIVGQPVGVREPLCGSEGFVVGCSDPSPDGERNYGVHVNAYGATFSLPASLVRTTGRQGVATDLRTRSRLIGRRTHPV